MLLLLLLLPLLPEEGKLLCTYWQFGAGGKGEEEVCKIHIDAQIYGKEEERLREEGRGNGAAVCFCTRTLVVVVRSCLYDY